MEDYMNDDDDDYYYFEGDSDNSFNNNDSDDFSNSFSTKKYENETLNHKITNKQFETLKLLRKVLNENKLLKKRINSFNDVLIENNYIQKLSSSLSIKMDPIKDKDMEFESTTKKIIKNSSDYINKSCQTDEISPEKVTTSLMNLVTDTSESIPIEEEINKFDGEKENGYIESKSVKTSSSLIKPFFKSITQSSHIIEEIKKTEMADQGCQTDNGEHFKFRSDQEKEEIENYYKKNFILKDASQNEIKSLNEKIFELNSKYQKLEETKLSLEKSFDLVNERFNESLKMNILLKEDNSKLELLNKLIDFLKAENDQIGTFLKTTQEELEKKETIINSLNETLTELNNNQDEKDIIIVNLKSENEKNLKEKHTICQQKISDLLNDSQKCKEKINLLENDIKMLKETNQNLSKQVERYQIEQKNFNFKEFVALKREINSLKEERERRFTHSVIVQTNSTTGINSQASALPPIKSQKKTLFNFFNQNN